ncbi:MAG: hypothetical protein BGP03_20045 [Pseudonocardia sp. 73-21]|nr:MAG: hypothetical protein BGP03_20045 [Pseudonocardia sp. 73-21]
MGVATARQLVEFGFSERTVYRRCLDGGPWQRILPGVILLFTGRPTRTQQVHAALLLCGPDAVVTGLEVCRRHGVRRGPARPVVDSGEYAEVQVLIPDDRQVRSVGFVHVTRTKRLPGGPTRDGVPLAAVPRACADAVQRGVCTISSLAEELDSGSRRGIAAPTAVLKELRAGVRSAAELAAKRLWPKTGLPEPWWNATVRDAEGRFLGIADCWLDEVAVVWEIESSEWHLSPEDHDLTVERAAGFTAAGAVHTATKPTKLETDAPYVIGQLRATYEQASNRARPTLTAERARAT